MRPSPAHLACVTLRSSSPAAYSPEVPTAVSVFSNITVTPEQVAWLLNQFEALQEHSGEYWTTEVGPGDMDVVGVADGTDDLASMPVFRFRDTGTRAGTRGSIGAGPPPG